MDPLASLSISAAAGLCLGWLAARLVGRRDGGADPAPRRAELEAEAARLAGERVRVDGARAEAEGLAARARARLAELAGPDAHAARKAALEELDRELAAERARRVAAEVAATREEADVRARAIVCTALQRVAGGHAAERTVTSVDLPDEAFKGRIVGREGRNVRAFEKATGCDVLVDDAPGVVTIAGFDPVRREAARRAMVDLVADGRIHPVRIEEAVAAATKALEAELLETGRAALLECDLSDAHPRILTLLGRLRYRTSYGQNVLRHAVEVSHLCGAMASEMRLDPRLARRAGLLHDLGKAVDHDVEGAHAPVGGDVARRCGEAGLVVNAIASHHEDVPQESAYAVIVQVCDAISAARPGARSDSAEKYVRRMKDLEAVAAAFPGVTEAYAVQAGREVRVIVDAATVSDADAPVLARSIAKAVEQGLSYPGEIRVTVLRETQVIDWAR